MIWLQLTEQTGQVLLVNIDILLAMRPMSNGTQILFCVPGPNEAPVSLLVKETTESILNRIAEAGGRPV